MTFKEPKISPELVADHGITPEEYGNILELLGRAPSFTELGIFSAMWNEHCSYKSTKKWLRKLPTKGRRVIQGPGENAGVVDIGDGQVVVFKMESHNHPSFIEPYQGAATGVGGILRDVFTMGARPIASMNALRFGSPDHPKTKHLLSGVVSGIGGYGNSFGVPTVGGELSFHPRYNENCLVNAFAAGIADQDKIFYSEAKGVGLPVVYLGAKTGRDGVGGATMASAEFSDEIEEKRPTVQVGDPFTEKCLLEACMELMASGAVIAIQDMGAAGLTCSAVEMGAKGDLGIELDLDKVPVREQGMSAYEIMLSESQERMLMILDPKQESIARDIFLKWELDFAIVGQTTDTLRFVIKQNGEIKGDLPIKELGDAAPEYDREWVAKEKPLQLDNSTVPEPADYKQAILDLLNSDEGCSRRWVYEQYDTLVQSNTVDPPGGNAGVVQVNQYGKSLAFSVDVNPRYCEADPYEGGKQAVAECWRNLCAVGAKPLAATDNLNFGNPERPEIMGTLVESIKGISEACKILEFPIVSGNVSLYNETNGQAILPTPAIGGVGLIDKLDRHVSCAFANEGDEIFLVGTFGTSIAQSLYQWKVLGHEKGPPPPVDLYEELFNGNLIQNLTSSNKITACHDLSDGGLAIALAEMAIKGNMGCKVTVPDPVHISLFGEDQSRYLITTSPENVNEIRDSASMTSIELTNIGQTIGSDLVINDNISIPVEELTTAYESWLPNYMNTQ